MRGSGGIGGEDPARFGGGHEHIRIAVLDGPVDLEHPCFTGARISVIQTQAGNAGGAGALAHGTHVASIIFGQPGSSVEGVAPRCSGLIVPIFSEQTGKFACSQLDLARAILLALEHGAHIINISGGQLSQSGEPDPLLANAIETCARRNVLIVAAAGNDGCACLHVPAAAPTVLAVGAMNAAGVPLESSNWGPAYGSQGILAPGTDVLGAAPGGGTARRSGTSFATPFVSGLAAVLAGLQLTRGRPSDPHAIRAALLKHALPCVPGTSDDCRKILAGRLNIADTVRAITGGDTMTEDIDMPNLRDASSWTHSETMPGAAALAGAAAYSVLSAKAPSDGIRPSGEESAATAVPTDPPAGAGLITPSDCGCGCGGKGKNGGGDEYKGGCGCGGGEAKKPQLVYALGQLGYDFGSEARRDSLVQTMRAPNNNPMLPEQWLAHLESDPQDATAVIWTLNLDATPIYAVQPVGAYADVGYGKLRQALADQLSNPPDRADLISVPGVIGGSTRLQSGQVVPVIVPAIRGIYDWAAEPLVKQFAAAAPEGADARDVYERFSAGLSNYLDRVYYDLRNLGLTGEERALNYSATNAVQVADVIRATTENKLDLDRIAVKKSPVCRPDSECYDVEISFFNPDNTNVASRIYRFTVDVSDVVPVTVGTVRSWTRRV
ncbi:PatA/PatG family cyanobactin maturation protease [Mesorhizobium sp. LHD-90]|uniref:PatA/PatG family cyanobactin maturation protease n=1 Tax=Mesorhizobium sp. LHD-90 TaxID=3071414 RepID=UPI0027E02F8D|nr:PatA/PatG family cyanobactin maturation protease [Mesorhizobium sp. LHD-90]MDQ6436123.1 PatA/PatG family cyanobactin maturation protease [Mesorhizobium sp. LHD-90]